MAPPHGPHNTVSPYAGKSATNSPPSPGIPTDNQRAHRRVAPGQGDWTSHEGHGHSVSNKQDQNGSQYTFADSQPASRSNLYRNSYNSPPPLSFSNTLPAYYNQAYTSDVDGSSFHSPLHFTRSNPAYNMDRSAVRDPSHPDMIMLGPEVRRRLRRINYAGLMGALSDTDVDGQTNGQSDPSDSVTASLSGYNRPGVDVRLPGTLSRSSTLARKAMTLCRVSTETGRKIFAREEVNREQLRVVPSKKAKGYEKWKLERKKDVKAFKLKVREFGFMFNLWQSSFKTIEAHFGSAVLAYFLFVKWLFLINLFTSIVIISVIVLPQAILAPQTFNDSIHIQDNNTSHTVFVEEALSCSLLYKDSLDNYSVNAVDAEVIIDFFQGTGWMENTPLFIGFYFNKVYMYEDDRSYYNMPLGYILATFSYMLVALITMVQYTAEGMRSRVTTSGDRFYHSCNTIFCGWDSSLTEEKAANFKHKNLYAEYLNDLAEMRQAEARKSMTTSQVAKVYFVRFVVWVITLVILGAAGYLIYRVVAIWMPQLLAQENVINSGILKLLVEFLPSITMTVINILIPPVFIKMIDFEGYAPETEISVTISRTVILRVASLAVLLITLAIQITSCDIKCGTCEGVSMCWETYVGQQIYKLVILDLLVIPAMTLLVEFPRRLLVKRFPDNKLMKLVGLQEFDIPRNVLDIVYTQTICWIGGFFSPLIPVITVMKLFIFFYVKKVSLLKNLIPASRVYRASRASHFFMIILMVAFVMCTGAITYAMGRINPSQGCGPFRIYTTDDYYMFDTLYDAIQTLPSIVRDILNILGHWAFYVALVVILFLVIYYYKAVAGGNKYLASLLEEQLALEGKDRQFLLMRVNEALNLA